MARGERTPRDLERGHFIRVRRQELGLSQAELSWKARIDQTDISRIENGWLEPTADRWGKILNALEVTDLSWLGEVVNGGSTTGGGGHSNWRAQKGSDQRVRNASSAVA